MRAGKRIMGKSGGSNNNNSSANPGKIQCLLFDLDNTLIDIPNTWTFFDSIITEVIGQDYHLPIPSQAERDSLWRTGKEYIAILKNWGVTDSDDFWAKFDARDSPKRKKYISLGKIAPFSDVPGALEQLKSAQFIMGIVTNTTTQIALEEITNFRLQSYFELILGLGEKQATCKPEPDGIIAALKRLGKKASETLYVGDSTIDLIASKRAGVRPILIDRTGHKEIDPNEIKPTEFSRIKTLSELVQLLK